MKTSTSGSDLAGAKKEAVVAAVVEAAATMSGPRRWNAAGAKAAAADPATETAKSTETQTPTPAPVPLAAAAKPWQRGSGNVDTPPTESGTPSKTAPAPAAAGMC